MTITQRVAARAPVHVLLLAAVTAAAALGPWLGGCGSRGTRSATAPSTDAASAFVRRIEQAHGRDAWYRHDAVAADIVVEFGGRRAIDGVVTFTTDAGRSRIDLKDGTTLVFDGQRAWTAPASAEFPRARFHLLTWPYFAAIPFKLRDGGTRLAETASRPLNGTPHPTARLTFAPGTGDAPDDWYVLYQDPQTGRLAAMAYIVTYGAKPGDPPPEPHAILYDRFREIGGATVATDWTFYNWSDEHGVHGEPIGRVTLRNLRFLDPPPPDAFDKPAAAREDPLPVP